MRSRIMATGMELTPAERGFVNKRLGTMLKRHAHELLHIDVFLKDHNGPKGGRDLSATVRARLSSGRLVTVADIRDDLHGAITRATQRMGFAIRRAVTEARRIDRRKARGARREDGVAAEERLQELVLRG